METIKTSKADLENYKIIFREIGLIIALLLVFIAFRLKTNDYSGSLIEDPNIENVTEEMIPVTTQETKPPPPHPPAKNQTVITIVENDAEVESDIDIDVEADQETIIEEYIKYVPQEEEEEIVDEEEVFIIVESMPCFPGGISELNQYLFSSLKYPSLAREAGIQGKVFVTFVIEKDGSVSDVELLRGVGGGCDEEAIRVVEEMPNWIPGKQRNMPVRVRFNLPIKFTLK